LSFRASELEFRLLAHHASPDCKPRVKRNGC
jgi:hypothetical protein